VIGSDPPILGGSQLGWRGTDGSRDHGSPGDRRADRGAREPCCRRQSCLPRPARARVDLPPVPRRVRAHRALSCCGASGRSTRGGLAHVAMLLENHLELLALYGGCAYAGLSLFRREHGPARRHARRGREPVRGGDPGRRRASALRGGTRCRSASRRSLPRTCSSCARPASWSWARATSWAAWRARSRSRASRSMRRT